MLVDDLTRSRWLLHIDGEIDAPLRLSFQNGLVLEKGVQVGTYRTVFETVQALLGNSITLAIEESTIDALPVTMWTHRGGNAADLVKRGRLIRENL